MEKAVRPKVVGGINVKVVTGCGNMYVQMGWCNGKLFEVFATLGRGGGCAMGFSEALTRSITLGLRCGVPAAEYSRQLKGVMCPTPRPFPREDSVMSCPDAIGKILAVYGSLAIEDIIVLIQGLNHQTNQLSAGDEEDAAIKHMEELKEEREKLEDNPG